ncbi:hypothetical protein ACQKH5_11545 [Hyphomonas sp. NPDC076900]|uniref:hypothetical protein n=1 Tax=unclassified Hyphomonas TaxID=2630699 RepID=UPI003D03FEDB
MKAQKLAELLASTEDLLAWGQCSESINSVNELETVLKAKSRLNLIVFFALWSDEMSSHKSEDLSFKGLLAGILRIQIASGASAAAKATTALDDVVANDTTLEQVTDGISSFDLVASFVDKLQAAAGNRDAFEKVIALLQQKGVASKAQILAISQKYAGGAKPKSIEHALNNIRSKFSSEQLFNSKTG